MIVYRRVHRRSGLLIHTRKKRKERKKEKRKTRIQEIIQRKKGKKTDIKVLFISIQGTCIKLWGIDRQKEEKGTYVTGS